MDTDVAELGLHKLWAWYEANRKQVTLGAGLLVVAGLVIGFVVWQQGAKQQAASEALSDVEMGQLGVPNMQSTPEGYLKVANTYPHSAAGEQALLLAASSLFVGDKYEQSRAEFERFRHEHHDSPWLGEALLGNAACLDAEGRTNEAIAAYKEVIAHRVPETVLPQAKFALASLYEAQNQVELARANFEDVARQPYTSLGSEAGIRLEELQIKHPSLAPATPMPTNMGPSFDIEKR